MDWSFVKASACRPDNLLGEGAGCVGVYKLVSPATGEPFAVKLIKRSTVGFGDAKHSLPYLTGEWSESFGRPCMPFDAILVASRMMVSSSFHTCFIVLSHYPSAQTYFDIFFSCFRYCFKHVFRWRKKRAPHRK